MEELLKLIQEAIKGLSEGDKVKVIKYFEDLAKENLEQAKTELNHFIKLKKYTQNKRVLVRLFTRETLRPYKDNIIAALEEKKVPYRYKSIADLINQNDLWKAATKYKKPSKALMLYVESPKDIMPYSEIPKELPQEPSKYLMKLPDKNIMKPPDKNIMKYPDNLEETPKEFSEETPKEFSETPTKSSKFNIIKKPLEFLSKHKDKIATALGLGGLGGLGVLGTPETPSPGTFTPPPPNHEEKVNPWVKKQQKEGKLPYHLPSLQSLLAGSGNGDGSDNGDNGTPTNAPIPPESPAGYLLLNKVITDQLTKLQQQRNQYIQALQQNIQSFNSESAEKMKEMTDLLQHTQSQIEALQQQQKEVISKIPKLNLPPTAPYILAGLATVLAAFAFGKTKTTLGRIAVGSFLSGLLTGRQELVQQGIQQYQSILNQANEKYNLLQNNIANILNSTKLSLDEKQNELTILGQKYGFIINNYQDLIKGVDAAYKNIQAGNIALAKMQELADYHRELIKLREQSNELRKEALLSKNAYQQERLLQEAERIDIEREKIKQEMNKIKQLPNLIPQQQANPQAPQQAPQQQSPFSNGW